MKQEIKLLESKSFQKHSFDLQNEAGLLLVEAFNRIWKITDAYRKGELSESEATSPKVLQAILHYGNLEAGRANDAPRFHASCFAIPTAASGIYFSLLDFMDLAESGKGGKLLQKASEMLKVMGLQAWSQPLRQDSTDSNIVSIERFRNHVWWVGGNALAYRSLLPVAAMYRSIPMCDLLSEICQRGISMTSQTTYSDSFWTEGFTADGAGWGHGMQCLIWGYPIDGTSNALNILNILKGSPWAQKLSKENTEAIMNFMRGGNWYYYNGYRLPCLDRGSYVYNPKESSIPYLGMLNGIIKNWIESFTPQEQKELLQLQKEARDNRIRMEQYTKGFYLGTRWFFNNDDLIKKTNNYHLMINMASSRCDGLESAPSFADAYNFYPTDGMTLFQRNGNEYSQIMGAWDVTASPGVTAREGMDKLTPVENWRGYCSSYNYAGGAANGSENAVAGYIFQKMNASDKDGVNDRGNSDNKNQILYGFRAYKSYFILGDYMVALGAGITNLNDNNSEILRTTIDQTAWLNDLSIVKEGNIEKIKEGVYSFDNSSDKLIWLVQKNKFAYAILPSYTNKAFYSCKNQKTDWLKRNIANSKIKDLPQSSEILHIWIDHGTQPVNDTYGYVVYMGDGLPQNELPFHVLRNDTLIQAVSSNDNKVIEAVFYTENETLTNKDLALSVSAPCVVLIEETSDSYMFTVTDACMDPSLNEIQLNYNGQKHNIPLHANLEKGKPSTIQLKK